MSYNTGNPIGSIDPRDAADNKENFDRFAVSTARTYTDRLGVERKTVTGALQDYAAYNSRGVWTTATAYNVNDVWRDGPTGAFYLVLADYTSGASAASDIAGGNVAVHQPKDWVVSVATIADLCALEPEFDGQQFSVNSYHDLPIPLMSQGGGVFYWDEARSKADHNGGEIIDPDKPFPTDWSDTAQQEVWFTAGTSGVGCFVRSGSNNNIRMYEYGAKGDLTTDDTQSLKSAIASLDDGYTLHLVHNMRVNINSEAYDGSRGGYCAFRIEGLNNITIRGGSLILDKTPSYFGETGGADYCLMFAADCENLVFDSVKMFGDGQLKTDTANTGEFGYNLQFARCTNVLVDSCSIYNAWADNIIIRGFFNASPGVDLNRDVKIINCHLENARRANIVGISCDGLIISNNTLVKKDMNLKVSFLGWVINFETNASYNTCKNVIVSNNICKLDHGAGIRIQGAGPVEDEYNINITNNEITALNTALMGNFGSLIVATGNNTVISDNILRAETGTINPSETGIKVSPRFHKDTIISDNVLEAASVGTGFQLGISVWANESVDPTLNTNLKIRGNTQRNIASGAIYVSGISKFDILDNSILNGSTQNAASAVVVIDSSNGEISNNTITNDNAGIEINNSTDISINGGQLFVKETGVYAHNGSTNVFISNVHTQSSGTGSTTSQMYLNGVGNGSVRGCTFRVNTGTFSQNVRFNGVGYIFMSGNDFMSNSLVEWTAGFPNVLSGGDNRNISGIGLI